MKIIFLVIFISFYLINYSKSRDLESKEEIIKNLNNFLNLGFNPNKEVVIKEKYHFNINYIQPILNYSKYILNNDSINIIQPKLILYFDSKLSIPFNSKIIYSMEYNNLPVTILIQINFTNITFNKQEDNSYVFNYNFKNDNFISNSNIKFNFLENYSFFPKNELIYDEIKKFFNVYEDRVLEYLDNYPICDGLYFFKKLEEYILGCRKFNVSINSIEYQIDRPTILDFNFDKHTKYEKVKSKFINVKINMEYLFYGEYSYYVFTKKRSCIIKELYVYKNNITFGKFDYVYNLCDNDDEYLIKKIIETSKQSVIPFL